MKRFSLYITEAASMKIMLLGGPGSGKSTYSEAISKHFGIPHIYPGDVLRKSQTLRLKHCYLRGNLHP